MTAPPPDTTLDVQGMTCPLPVLRANRALRTMPPGAVLRVLATDRAALADFHAFCRETGHALLHQGEEAGVLSFTIRRRAEEPGRCPSPCSPTPPCLDHDTGPGHPECADRLRAVLQALEHPDFVPCCARPRREATAAQLELAHPAEYVAGDPGASSPSQGERVYSTATPCMSHGSRGGILRAAGGAHAPPWTR